MRKSATIKKNFREKERKKEHEEKTICGIRFSSDNGNDGNDGMRWKVIRETDSTTGGDKNRQKQPAEKKRLHFELDPDIRNPTHGSQRWKIIL